MPAIRYAAVVILLAACSGSMSEESARSRDAVSSQSASVSAVDDFAGRGVSLAPTSPANPATGRAMGGVGKGARAPSVVMPQQQTVVSSMIIRNGAVSIQVDSLERAIDRVRALATSLGGAVGSLAINTGEHQVRSATLELKIPAARFDSAMTGMPALGKVEHSSATAHDVGEEFVDVSARVANAKRLEERLLTLLTSRTGKLEDVLAVERELARVREEIERHEGRIRFLSTRIATSTITATVHEKAPIIAARPGDNVFVRAFINMWRNFVRFLTISIELLGVLLPVAGICVGLAFAWRRWRPQLASALRSPR